MKIAILTAQEPLYLPAFMDRFLKRRPADVVGIFPCRPIYKNQTTSSMLRRYVKTFGVWNAVRLTCKVLLAKLKDLLKIGRKRGKFYSIKAVAESCGVPVQSVEDVNDPGFIRTLRRQAVDLVLSVSCPQIFEEELINMPRLGCLNIHGADLPEYRGIMPSFWMLAHGMENAAVTIFYINAGIDTGDVAAKKRFPILPDDTLHSFIVRAKQEACDLGLEVIDQIEAGTVKRVPLEGEGSYFGWPTREAYRQFRRQGRRLW
jgi:methionyl-tRNA formyltransferase